MCRICGWKEETWQHIREKCLTRTELMEICIMAGDKEGIKWMRRVTKKRDKEGGTHSENK